MWNPKELILITEEEAKLMVEYMRLGTISLLKHGGDGKIDELKDRKFIGKDGIMEKLSYKLGEMRYSNED